MQGYLDRFPSLSVAVLGDVMLDCYLSGTVNRISPEAPVPVLHVRSQRTVPGGAANVAANLASLGLTVHLVGLIGADEAGRELLAEIEQFGTVDVAQMVQSAERPTIRKLRVVAGSHQIVRVDQEETHAIPPDVEARCIAAAKAAIAAADIVILSDYGKGFLSDAVIRAGVEHARALGRPVLVDPKRTDLTAYRGATIITPNRKELTAATGLPCETDEEVERAVAAAQDASGAAVLLTRSEKGMSFFSGEDAPIHLATVAQDVFDVSGAGDTVIAVFAATVAAGIPIHEGLRMANHAAGIVVSKFGTASVTRDELAAALASDGSSPAVADGRLLGWDDAISLRWAWHRERLTVGIANGCFDLLHPGHVSLIRQAAEHCDRLIVALNADSSVKRLKGPSRPVQSEEARAAVMGAIKGVAATVIFAEDTPLELITALQPDVLVKGEDYREDQVVGADVVKARGGRVVLASLSAGQSTSRLIERANGPG